MAAATSARCAAASGLVAASITSLVGRRLGPEFAMTVYGAIKACVLFLSQGPSLKLSPKGVYVQAVLPAGTRAEIRERAGIDVSTLSDPMEVGEMVDAALIGFDRRELVTIPPLRAAERWDSLDGARQGCCRTSGRPIQPNAIGRRPERHAVIGPSAFPAETPCCRRTRDSPPGPRA